MFSKIKIIYINKTDSTQNKVIEYIQNSFYPSILLVAKTQTKGRGRKDNDWYSPEGGFWATLGFCVSTFLNKTQLALFHYFTALLLTQVIRDEYYLSVQIKWPNDLLFKNKKLGGILIDYITGPNKNYILIGMGVNLNNSSSKMPENLKPIVISIKDILNKSVSLDDFAHKVCYYSNKYFTPITEYNQQKIQTLIQEYNHHSQIYGRDVILKDSQKYNCIGINEDGFLQFKNNNIYLNLAIDDAVKIKRIL
ncbi:MAG: biotin--[acetyl-CoA-carboxylase] ligase [Promethearchaeota archaeon]